MAKRLADILGGHVDIHGNGTAVPRLAPNGESPQLEAARVDAELLAVRKRMHALRDHWARDAGRALRDLRAFFHEPTMPATTAKAWLDTWLFAVDHPDEFERALDDNAPDALAFDARGWFRDLRAYLHLPPAITNEERAVLDRLLASHGWPTVEELRAQAKIELNPNIRQFEGLDPWWLSVAEAALITKLGRWPHLEPFVSHTKDAPFVYEAKPEELGRPIAMLADFGTGYYHSRMIARQLEQRAPSYAFHLGDVYYGGREQEFAHYYEAPLHQVVQRTKLFSIAENHELFSGGKWYLAFLRDAQKRGISPQQGSYFCVRFPHHQIIGLDVNWLGRGRFLHAESRQWLSDQLAAGGDRTTILVSGTGPYAYGADTAYSLLGDLWDFLRNGQIAMWLWGDDHYCALFDREPLVAPFYGTCIGHGGFPAKKQRSGKSAWSKPLWVEDEPRFPAWTGMRQDMLNNGWCELTLRDDGGFALTYLDWLGARRCHAAFAARAGAIQLEALQTFPRQQTSEQPPPLAGGH
jgi:hypothetical protein